jgi:hypothetical protein
VTLRSSLARDARARVGRRADGVEAWARARVEPSVVQILALVATRLARLESAEEGKGFMGRVIRHELVGPKSSPLWWLRWGVVLCGEALAGRKGSGLIFPHEWGCAAATHWGEGLCGLATE